MEKTIKKHVLVNAIKHDGKADSKSVIGSILHEDVQIRNKLKELMPLIESLVDEINALTLDQQKAELKEFGSELLTKKPKERISFPPLPDAVFGKVVTRIPPDPSKYLHVGHALSFLINAKYAQKYGGKVILRFEDTNPEVAQQEYVDAIRDDIKNYLEIPIAKEFIISDDMEKIYAVVHSFLEKQQAYVCTCDREILQEQRHKGIACNHQNQSTDTNMYEWKRMLEGFYNEGDAVVRMKIDMDHENQVLRDPVLMRICQTPHYRHGTKYVVYPMYDLANVLEDAWCGVTHILRSNEFGQMRLEFQDIIRQKLGLPSLPAVQYGRFGVSQAITKGREIRELIEKGEVSGWDDPKLMTLRAMNRRGIVRETLIRLSEEVGITPSQTTIDWKTLATINRQILDPTARRFFFIWDPVKVKVQDAKPLQIQMDLHPQHLKGGRHFQTSDSFFLTKNDVDKLESGHIYRLMNCLNFLVRDKSYQFQSFDVQTYKAKGKGIMHWLPDVPHLVKVSVITPDTVMHGLGEHTLNDVSVGEIVQFERFGFCRCDKIEGDHFTFVFGHP